MKGKNCSDSEENSEDDPKTFSGVAVNFAERTSMQGVPYVHHSKTIFGKGFWTLIFVLGCGGMSAHLYMLFDDFYSYKSTTTVDLGFSPLSFPAVTFCNVNRIRNSLRSLAADRLQNLMRSVEPTKIADAMQQHRNSGPGNPAQMEGTTQRPETQSTSGSSANQLLTTIANNGFLNESKVAHETSNTYNESAGSSSSSFTSTSTGNSVNSYTATSTGKFNSTTETTGSINTKYTATTTSRNAIEPSQPVNSSSINGKRKKRATDESGQTSEIQSENKLMSGFSITQTSSRFDMPKNSKQPLYQGNKCTSRLIEDDLKYFYSAETRDNRVNMGHQIGDMLVSCSFSGIECKTSDFTLVNTIEYGNCFTIANDNFTSISGGTGSGLELILFLEFGEYISGMTQSLPGIQVLIHEKDTFPYPYKSGFAASGSMETFVALRQMNIQRLSQPYGFCHDDDTFQSQYGVKYSQTVCQIICIQETINRTCGCFDTPKEEFNIRSPYPTNITICSNETEIACLKQIEEDFIDNKLNCSCDSPCKETAYLKTESIRSWPSDDYANVLKQYLCNVKNDTECDKYSSGSLRQEFIKLNIYFEDLNYENISEEPSYQEIQLLSDVGGTIGLWIGLSIISFFEVLQFVCEILQFFLFARPRQRSKVTSSPEIITDKKMLTSVNHTDSTLTTSDKYALYAGNAPNETPIKHNFGF